MDSNELVVAYQDNSQCWPILRQLISSLFPIKEIRFNFDIGDFSVKNYKIDFYQAHDPFFDDISNPIKAYKRPYVYIYIVTFFTKQEYQSTVKAQVDAFINLHYLKLEGEEKDEWLVIYTTPKPIASELEYKSHNENFQLLENDFKEHNQNQSVPRIISVFGFDAKVKESNIEIFNVTFDGLYKFSLSFMTSFQRGVQTRVASLEEKVLNMLELKDSQNWDFLKFFALKENIAIIFENLTMHLAAFQKYEELRNKYYEGILRKPEKLKFIKEEFYLKSGKENPYLLDIQRETIRGEIFDNKISEFDFVQYLFARQAMFLKLMNWHHEGIDRVKLLISDVFHRSVRELPPIQDHNKYMAFKHIWTIQALHGFLDFFQSPNSQVDLSYTRLDFKHYVILHLEQLYELLYGASINKIKTRSFNEEFETLLDILEHGAATVKDEISKPSIDVSQFNIKEARLQEVLTDREAFLNFIFEEKIKFYQSAMASGCKKMAQFKYIECLKYRIQQHKIDLVKVDDVVAMINSYDAIKLYDISDVLRIYLMRVYLQRRNIAELAKPFMSICKHQSDSIQNHFDKNKNRNAFKILDAFCQRNIQQSLKIPKADHFKLKDLNVKVDNTKGIFDINYNISNELLFSISNCKLQFIIRPADLRKTEDKSYKRQYEKYTVPLEVITPGENINHVQFKGKNSGTYKLKNIFLKISKFRFKVTFSNQIELNEFTIKEENKYSVDFEHKTLDNIMPDGRLPTDNELPFVAKFSQYTFKFDRVRFELQFASPQTGFGSKLHVYSINEKEEFLREESLEQPIETTNSRIFEIKPSADVKGFYIVFTFHCNSRNSEVWDNLNFKVNYYSKSNNITSKDYSIALHFNPLFEISPTYHNLPKNSFLHLDLINSCLYPIKIHSLGREPEEELIEPQTRIEPSEEFSAILDQPKEKSGKILNGKIVVSHHDINSLMEGYTSLPNFVKDKVHVNSEYTLDYDYRSYLDKIEPYYKVEIDFPKTVLYHQSYVMVVKIHLLEGAQTKECEVSINDDFNNWIFFGMVKSHVSLTSEQPHELHFNLIPISVGDVALPKIVLYPKKVQEKSSQSKKKPNLAINLQEINIESEALSSEKLDIRFTNSQFIQVFNNSTVCSENFSLI